MNEKITVQFSNYFETEVIDDYTSRILNSDGEKISDLVCPDRMIHTITFKCVHCQKLSSTHIELIKEQRHQRNVMVRDKKGDALLSFVTYKIKCEKCGEDNDVIYDVQPVASTIRSHAMIIKEE